MQTKPLPFILLHILPFIMVLTGAAACKKQLPFPDRLIEGSQYDTRDQTVSRPEDVKEILIILRSILAGIEKKDLSALPGWIDPKRGVYVDLKALRTAPQFGSDLADMTGYVNTYYLNSEELRRRTGDAGQKSLFEVISRAEKIRGDFYFQGDECEVRLSILGDQSSESYRFNNPYFIKTGGRWTLFRLP